MDKNKEIILFVDDEPNVLQSMKRQLRKRFSIKTAPGGQEALDLLKEEGPVSVIVSDMRMPGMDGVQLLSRTKDLYPDMVRLMLTGNADQGTAMEAVNTGHIFRFLTKPCATANLVTSLALALRQHRLITAEKQLLNETLKGSLNVMSELLSLANAAAFSSGYRIKDTVRQIAEQLTLPQIWQFEIAALMSQIGCITLPNEILHKLQSGVDMSEEEKETYYNHPGVGKQLVGQIPRLELVAGIIENQLKPFGEYADTPDMNEDVAIGGQILKAVIDYDLLRHQGLKHSATIKEMESVDDVYNPEVLKLLAKIEIQSDQIKVISIKFQDVVAGMVAEEDVMATNGTLIIPKGQEISWSVIQGVQNFVKHIGIQEPIKVRVQAD